MNPRTLSMAFRLGVRQSLQQPLAVLGQLTVLTALLVSYGGMLPAIPLADQQRLGFTASQMIWYLTITETVAMVSIWNFRQMQYDIRSGVVDIWLLRPVAFWPLLLAEWAGQELPRLIPVAAVAVSLGRLLSGGWELGAGAIVLLIPTIVASAFITQCWCFLLGIAAVWLNESGPLFWVYQKLLFVLGALLWPLALYPVWLRSLAWLTPFPAIVATPGSFALHQPGGTIALHAAIQGFWIVAYLAACAFTAGAARRRLMR